MGAQANAAAILALLPWAATSALEPWGSSLLDGRVEGVRPSGCRRQKDGRVCPTLLSCSTDGCTLCPLKLALRSILPAWKDVHRLTINKGESSTNLSAF